MVERIGARSVQVGTEVPTEPAKTQEVPAEKDSFKPALVEKKSSGPIAEARTVLLGSSLSLFLHFAP
jgi:hypothetical protein